MPQEGDVAAASSLTIKFYDGWRIVSSAFCLRFAAHVGNRTANRAPPKAGGNRPWGEHVFAHGTTICASALGRLSPAALAAVTRTFTVLPLGRPLNVASLSVTVTA